MTGSLKGSSLIQVIKLLKRAPLSPSLLASEHAGEKQ